MAPRGGGSPPRGGQAMQNQGSRPDLYRGGPASTEPEFGDAVRPASSPALKRAIVALVAAAVGFGGWKLLAGKSIWLDDVDAGLAAAQASGKPMLVFFTADWCPPCRQLKRGPLSEPGVKGYITENYVPVKVDLTDRSGSGAMNAAQTGVNAIPAMILYDTDGRETDRFVGGEIVEFLAGADP